MRDALNEKQTTESKQGEREKEGEAKNQAAKTAWLRFDASRLRWFPGRRQIF